MQISTQGKYAQKKKKRTNHPENDELLCSM